MRRAIAAFGRTLVTLGLLILLFVAFQLWGTGIFTARAQDDMRAEFEHQLDRQHHRRRPSTTRDHAPVDDRPRTSTDAAGRPGAAGDWIGTIKIPKIGVDKIFVEGTGRDDLKKGPGHYPGTPLPGQVGNAAIAGHRTTYGQPFFDLDKLEPGDEIVTTSVVGDLHVRRHRQAHRAARATRTSSTTPPDAQLTLTTCNPKFSARERLVIKAELVPDASRRRRSKPRRSGGERRTHAPTLAEGPRRREQAARPRVRLGRDRRRRRRRVVVGVPAWRHPLTWLAGVVPFLIVLFGFYFFLERVPARGLLVPADVRRRARRRDAHRPVRPPHTGAHERSAGRVARHDRVPEGASTCSASARSSTAARRTRCSR